MPFKLLLLPAWQEKRAELDCMYVCMYVCMSIPPATFLVNPFWTNLIFTFYHKTSYVSTFFFHNSISFSERLRYKRTEYRFTAPRFFYTPIFSSALFSCFRHQGRQDRAFIVTTLNKNSAMDNTGLYGWQAPLPLLGRRSCRQPRSFAFQPLVVRVPLPPLQNKEHWFRLLVNICKITVPLPFCQQSDVKRWYSLLYLPCLFLLWAFPALMSRKEQPCVEPRDTTDCNPSFSFQGSGGILFKHCTLC